MLTRFFRLLFAASVLALASAPAFAQAPARGAARLLPDRVGDFRAQGSARPHRVSVEHLAPEDFAVVSGAARDYAGRGGAKVSVEVVETSSPSAAYSLLLHQEVESEANVGIIRDLGTVGMNVGDRVRFIKGSALVELRGGAEAGDASAARLDFARAYAEAVEGEPADIPVLVQHLPDWQAKAREWVGHAVTPRVLLQTVREPVLEAVSFEGGTEAVAAEYDGARLVVVEFTTPQYAADNDARISQQIAQLRAAGQPAPSFYQRVGNYSVFVFGAADERAAADLAGQVKYEKDVRWLGQNPYAEERAQRAYTQTMGGVILITLKMTGLAILTCLGLGGLVGGVVFLLRRSRSAAAEAYSDAGGMMRLNLEDVNAPRVAGRLTGGVEK